MCGIMSVLKGFGEGDVVGWIWIFLSVATLLKGGSLEDPRRKEVECVLES